MTRAKLRSFLSSDVAMLVAWGCWLAVRVIGESTLQLGSLISIARAIQLAALILALLHGVTAPVSHEPRVEAAWLVGIALLCASGFVSDNYVLAQAAVLVYGSRGMDKLPLYRESLLIIVSLCLLLVLLSQLGVVEDIIVETRADRVRHCLGFLWPSRLPNFLFTVIILLVLIRGRYLRLATRLALLVASCMLYFLTKSRGPFLASVLLVACKIVLWFRPQDELPAWARRSLVAMFPSFAVLTLVPSIVYDHNISWMRRLNWVTSNRLIYSHNAIASQGVTLFGNPAFDDASVADPLAGYLDAAYLRLLCSMGLVAFLLVMVVLVMLTIHATKRNDRPLLACLFVCALHSCLEGNLLWIQYTPLLFAASDAIDERLGATRSTAPLPADGPVLFAVCTPFQLFSALCVRLNPQLCDEGAGCDLLISPNFPRANEYASQLRRSGLFQNVVVFSSYEGTYFPQVKDFIDYLVHPGRRRREFASRWPLLGQSYTQVYCADPNTVIDVRLFQCEDGATVTLFDEGAGSYNGSMASTFCVDNAAVATDSLGFGLRQRVKFALKDLASIVDVLGRYQCVPARIALFNTTENVRRIYRDVPIKQNVLPDLVRIAQACPLLAEGNADCYRSAGVVFFASWDDALPVRRQLELAQWIGGQVGRPVVFRPHPRSNVQGLEAEGVTIDTGGVLWELLCAAGAVDSQAILAGFASTAQVMPKVLRNEEPPLLVLSSLLDNSVPYKQRLVRAAEQFQDLYVNKARVQIPQHAGELRDAVRALECVGRREATDDGSH